jgi:hypothetical protein
MRKEVLFHNEEIAKERYNFVYNEMVQSMLNFDENKTKAYQEMLLDIRSLNQTNEDKIDF